MKLRVTGTLRDPKSRYRLAKEIVEKHTPHVPVFGAVLRTLEPGEAVLANDLTHEVALEISHTLAGQLVSSSLQPADAEQQGLSVRRKVLMLSGLAAVLLSLACVFVVAAAEHLRRRPSTRVTDAAPRPAAAHASQADSLPTAGRASPAPPTPPRPVRPLSSTEIAARSMRSIVMLRCPRSTGTGFFITPHLVLTNAHATCPQTIAYNNSGNRSPTRLRWRDTLTDAAVLQVSGFTEVPLPLGDSRSVHVGDTVYILGTPRGLDFTIGRGMVSQVRVPVRRNVSFIQIDGNINPGNSGGPVVNEFGDVVGVVTLGMNDATGTGFALPIYALDLETAGLGALRARTRRPDHGADSTVPPPPPGRHYNQGPQLVGAAVNEKRVTVTMAYAKVHPPPPATLDFELAYANPLPCIRTAHVTVWAALHDGAALPTAVRSALQPELRAGITYLGEFAIDTSACPSAQQMVGAHWLRRVSVQGAHGPGSSLSL